MKINFEEWFEQKPETVNMGVELELFLLDSRTKLPLTDYSKLETILNDLPWNIYHDHYPHQLELRTDPCNNPNDIILQTKALYKEASDKFGEQGIFIIPVPNITTDPSIMWCGMHTHISYPDRKQTAPYWGKAMTMYPFILSIADHTKNFEINDTQAGERIKQSKHIGLPLLGKSEFLKGSSGERKYRDLILSNAMDGEEQGRTRLSKPTTIEARIFDTPSLFTTYESMIHMIFKLAEYAKIVSPMTTLIEHNPSEASRVLSTTRNYISSQRYGVNKVFHRMNTDVCEDICQYFKIPFCRETQFEFRERLGIQANINGYLSMAIEGGWLD